MAWAGLAVALLLAGCGEGGGLDRLAAGERGKVISVESGQGFTLDSGLVVRLAGIEAPWMDEPGGEAARADLARLVLGREVQLFYGGARRDAGGRALAQARRTDDRRWIEGALLRDGWARVRTFGDNRALAQPSLEEAAAAVRRRNSTKVLIALHIAWPTE